MALCHPTMQPQTKFGIPTSKNIGDMYHILETRSEVKVNVTRMYMTLHHPKMHPHTEFGIPSSDNIRDMLQTR